MSNLHPSSEETLRRYAKQLDAQRRRKWFARPMYDILGDALIWQDELVSEPSIELTGAIRNLTHYRTGLIIGEDRGSDKLWRLGRELFPHWVGFHRSRCRPSAKLARTYHAHASALKRELEEWDKFCDEAED